MAASSLILVLSALCLDWPYLGSGSLVGRVYRSRTRICVKRSVTVGDGRVTVGSITRNSDLSIVGHGCSTGRCGH